jgi:hypothetical protein
MRTETSETSPEVPEWVGFFGRRAVVGDCDVEGPGSAWRACRVTAADRARWPDLTAEWIVCAPRCDSDGPLVDVIRMSDRDFGRLLRSGDPCDSCEALDEGGDDAA